MRLRDLVWDIATSPQSVTALITGPTGSGKEACAQAIHAAGASSAEPFEIFHCDCHPDSLFEAALFGHEKGAFTGASHRAEGACTAAGSGTLLLDEIGNLPLALQAKLLRVVDTRKFRRVGGTNDETLGARILAATNVDLEAAVAKGLFRLDLFHRLKVVVVRLPPLSARLEDIPILANAFALQHGEFEPFAQDALDDLEAREWTGHVRELRNLVIGLLTRVRSRPIRGADIARGQPSSSEPLCATEPHAAYERIADVIMALGGRLDDHVDGVRETVTRRAVTASEGKIRRAAALLGIDPSTLRGRLASMERTRSRGGRNPPGGGSGPPQI